MLVVDAHSKWPEVFEMSSTTTLKTITILRHLFVAYGLPEQVVSDNGPQFTSEEFKVFLKRNGVKYICCAPYHPSSNGAAERFVQTFKQAMKASIKEPHPVAHRLANFLLTYRSTPHATTNVAPCTLFLQRELRTRFNLPQPDNKRRVCQKQAEQVSHHDQHSKHRDFVPGQSVMVRNLRPGPKWISGIIIYQLGPLSFLIKLETGVHQKRHVDHIRDFSLKPPSTPTSEEADASSSFEESDIDLPHLSEAVSDQATVPAPAVVRSPPPVQAQASHYPSQVHQPPDRLDVSFGRGGV